MPPPLALNRSKQEDTMQIENRSPIVVPPGHGTTWQVLGETITRKVVRAQYGVAIGGPLLDA